MTPAPEAVSAEATRPREPRRWVRRVAWSGAGAVALVVAAVCVAELAGWPFLARPMQTALSKALHRPVFLEGGQTTWADTTSLAPSASGGAASSPANRQAGGVRVRLFGRVDVRAQRIEIGAPDWGQGPPLLVAENARLELRYGDLWRTWRRGEALKVRRLEAERLAVDLERRADGRASWQFAAPGAKPAEPAADLPVFEQLRVDKGELALRDALLDSRLTARFSLRDGVSAATPADATASRTPTSGAGSAAADTPAGLRAEATGRYRQLPLKLSLQTVGVLPWVADEAEKTGVPLTVDGQVGGARLRFDGSVRDVQRLAGLDGKFRLAGPSLAAVGDVIGVTLPTTGPFSTRGQLRKDAAVWDARIDEALIGRSQLSAQLRYDPTLLKPLLSGTVKGPRLLLADLGPAIGTAPAPAAPGAPATPAKDVPAPVVAAPGRILPA